LAAAVAQTAGTYAGELQGHRLSFTAFKQAPWYMTAKFAIERSQLSFRTPYFDNELVALAYQVPADLVSSNEISLQLIADGQEALRKVGTDRGLVLKKIPGLTKAAHLLQEFTFKAEYAYDYGMPQWLAAIDHVFAPLHLERLFLGRHKFHHFRVYYRDHWASYVRQVLLDARSRNRSYLDGATLERLVNDHLVGRRNHTVLLHKLLSLELVQRQFIERA
jgi:asparagine synthase (glutamine-hydrolysing)